MYCPNCGATNNKKQNFCRYCGLHLTEIEKIFSNQLVFGTETKQLKNLRQVRRITEYAQYFAFLTLPIGVIFLFYDSSLGKTLITASLLAFFMTEAIRQLFGYFQRQDSQKNTASENLRTSEQHEIKAKDTNKLLEEKPFIPVPSVTENSTELLYQKVNARNSDEKTK